MASSVGIPGSLIRAQLKLRPRNGSPCCFSSSDMTKPTPRFPLRWALRYGQTKSPPSSPHETDQQWLRWATVHTDDLPPSSSNHQGAQSSSHPSPRSFHKEILLEPVSILHRRSRPSAFVRWGPRVRERIRTSLKPSSMPSEWKPPTTPELRRDCSGLLFHSRRRPPRHHRTAVTSSAAAASSHQEGDLTR